MAGHWQRRLRRLENWLADLVARRARVPRAERVIFVCKGNVCRSAFAERYALRVGLAAEVLSAGIETSQGARSPETAVRTAAALGVDLSGHRSRHIDQITDGAGSVYLVMEPWHARHPGLAAAARQGRVLRLGSWASPPLGALRDPYGRSQAVYLESFRTLSAAVDALACDLALERGSRASNGDVRSPPASGSS
jgi:protein-tyrosine phosphatase